MAAYATARGDSLLVALEYKGLVPIARQGRFEGKVQEINKELKEAWKWKTAKRMHRRRCKKASARDLRGATGNGSARV